MFVVGEFSERDSDDKTIAVIPEKWMLGTGWAAWPPYKGPIRFNKAVANQEDRQDSWEAYNVRVLYRTESLAKARQKARQTEETSDLVNDVDQPRKRKRGAAVTLTPLSPEDLLGVTSPTEACSSRCDSPSMPCIESAREKSGFGHKVLHLLEEIRSQVLQNTVLLQALVYQMAGVKDENSELPEDMSFPLSTVAEVDRVERLLSSLDGNELERRLVSHFGIIGGANVEETVRRMMTRMLSKPVAVKYCMKGSTQKMAFEPLRLNRVLMGAVRKNSPTATASDAEIAEQVKNWFRNAQDRLVGRNNRVKRTAEMPDIKIELS